MELNYKQAEAFRTSLISEVCLKFAYIMPALCLKSAYNAGIMLYVKIMPP